ncbi:hypothetical protein C5O19_24135 [Siphonobacter curvatus]|uniref:Double zinc ribbon domain-containing protein n=2 Tax=Siphonobacter curvatus TaxID=2094562 RepID=A0A2S7IFI8_9BACT|nr:hypothetical protein C5O19_24135 [Siphonobacter curvatus]
MQFLLIFPAKLAEKLTPIMKSYWQSFWTLLFPRICLDCQQTLAEGEDLLCTTCRFDLPVTRSWQTGDSIVADKFAGKIPVASVHAYLKFRKGGKVQHFLHQLKYNNEPEVGPCWAVCSAWN